MMAFTEVVDRFATFGKVSNLHDGEKKVFCPNCDAQCVTLSEGDDGRTLIYCHAGCATEAVLTGASLNWSDVLPEREHTNGASEGPPPRLHDWAADRRLPVAALEAEGARNINIGVLVEHRNSDGEVEPPHQVRVAGGSWRWTPSGLGAVLYGEQHLAAWRKAGKTALLIVEGITDYLTAIILGYAVLGLPGASMAGLITAEHLRGFDKVYVLREPDAGGLNLTTGVFARLGKKNLCYSGEMLATCFPSPAEKDLNAFWIARGTPSAADFSPMLRELSRPLADVAREDAAEKKQRIADAQKRRAEAGQTSSDDENAHAQKESGDAPHGAKKQKEPESWPSITPLFDPAPPELPIDAFPPVVEKFIEAEAEARQVSPDLVAGYVLGATSTGCAAKFTIRYNRRYSEPANTFIVNVALSGERKSAVLGDVCAEVFKYEQHLIRATREAISGYEWDAQYLKAEAESLTRIAAAPPKKDDQKSQGDRKVEARATWARYREALRNIPAEPQILVDDITPEKTSSMLCEQGGRLSIMSAEGGFFDIAAGRYAINKSVNIDVYLKAYSGEPLKVSRENRKAEYVESPSLTLCIAVQPSVLHGLMSKPGFFGRGLLNRPLWSFPRSRLGYRRTGTAATPMDPEIEAKFRAVLRTILNLPAFKNMLDQTVPTVLDIEEPGLDLLRGFEAEVEKMVHPDGPLASISGWGSKIFGNTLRIALLLEIQRLGGFEIIEYKNDGVSPDGTQNLSLWPGIAGFEYAGETDIRARISLYLRLFSRYSTPSTLEGDLKTLKTPTDVRNVPREIVISKPVVTVGSVRGALKLARYFIEHALIAFGAMKPEPEIEAATQLAEWVRRNGKRTFTRREIHQAHRRTYRKIKDLDAPLALLVEHGYLRGPKTIPAGEQGGRPSSGYEVNPEWVSPPREPGMEG